MLHITTRILPCEGCLPGALRLYNPDMRYRKGGLCLPAAGRVCLPDMWKLVVKVLGDCILQVFEGCIFKAHDDCILHICKVYVLKAHIDPGFQRLCLSGLWRLNPPDFERLYLPEMRTLHLLDTCVLQVHEDCVFSISKQKMSRAHLAHILTDLYSIQDMWRLCNGHRHDGCTCYHVRYHTVVAHAYQQWQARCINLDSLLVYRHVIVHSFAS